MSQNSVKSESQIDKEMNEMIEDMVTDAVRDYTEPRKKYFLQHPEKSEANEKLQKDLQDYIFQKQAEFDAEIEKDLRENYINQYLCPEDFLMIYDDWFWPTNMSPSYKIEMVETRILQRRMAERYREVGEQLEFWFIYTGEI